MQLKRLFIFFLIIFLLSILSIFYPNLTAEAIKSEEYQKENAILERVIDGDTIEARVNNETWKIRMLGINTPEKKMPYSNEGADFLKQFTNLSIQLLRDREDTDKYERKLRYVFYEGNMLNLEITKQGFATVYMAENLKYESKFIRAEQEARELGRGLWKKSSETCAKCLSLKELNATSEFFIIRNICNFDCNLNNWFVKDTGRNLFWLDELSANSEKKIESAKQVWNNDHDNLFLYDSKGELVLFYSY